MMFRIAISVFVFILLLHWSCNAQSSPTTLPTPTSDSSNNNDLELKYYSVQQLNFILNHIMETTQSFVIKVLSQHCRRSLSDHTALKRFLAELKGVFEATAEDTPVSYDNVANKLKFLHGRRMHKLPQQLSPALQIEYREQDKAVAAWLDKTAERMRSQINYFTSEDPLRFQHFNNLFDDIATAKSARQKLDILADMLEIVIHRTEIRFVDLYMQ